MMGCMAGLMSTIRKAIEASGHTRYRIAKETGIAASQLSRLVNGETGLSVESIEKLADYLGLEIVVRPKRRRKAR
jgi:transcriptional regulator with XRE-family HTH domain